MSKVSLETWATAKALYEKGDSLRDIEKATGIAYKTIDNRAKVGGWEKGLPIIADARTVGSPDCIYLITANEYAGIYKIGLTSDVDRRLRDMQTACPFVLYAFRAYTVINPAAVEAMLHAFFHKKRLKGEWFRLNEVDLQYIDDALEGVEDILNG